MSGAEVLLLQMSHRADDGQVETVESRQQPGVYIRSNLTVPNTHSMCCEACRQSECLRLARAATFDKCSGASILRQAHPFATRPRHVIPDFDSVGTALARSSEAQSDSLVDGGLSRWAAGGAVGIGAQSRGAAQSFAAAPPPASRACHGLSGPIPFCRVHRKDVVLSLEVPACTAVCMPSCLGWGALQRCAPPYAPNLRGGP